MNEMAREIAQKVVNANTAQLGKIDQTIAYMGTMIEDLASLAFPGVPRRAPAEKGVIDPAAFGLGGLMQKPLLTEGQNGPTKQIADGSDERPYGVQR
jgi:hypothetical protein